MTYAALHPLRLQPGFLILDMPLNLMPSSAVLYTYIFFITPPRYLKLNISHFMKKIFLGFVLYVNNNNIKHTNIGRYNNYCLHIVLMSYLLSI